MWGKREQRRVPFTDRAKWDTKQDHWFSNYLRQRDRSPKEVTASPPKDLEEMEFRPTLLMSSPRSLSPVRRRHFASRSDEPRGQPPPSSMLPRRARSEGSRLNQIKLWKSNSFPQVFMLFSDVLTFHPGHLLESIGNAKRQSNHHQKNKHLGHPDQLNQAPRGWAVDKIIYFNLPRWF